MSNLTVVNPKEFGIEETQAQGLMGNLPQIKEERSVLELQYDEVVKLDIEDPETTKKARELRLLIQKNRTQGIAVWHKTNKEMFLRGGQFVDAIKNVEIAVNQRMEENLEQIEKHAEIKEQQRIEALNKERIELVAKCGVDGTNLHLGSMTNDVWDAYYSGVVSKYEQEQEQLAREEQERIAKEKKQALHSKRKEELISLWGFMTEDQQHSDFSDFTQIEFDNLVTDLLADKQRQEAQIEAQRIENERLKKEAEAKEKALEEERAKAKKEADELEAKRQSELKAERDKQAKLESELKAKKDAEDKAEKDRLAKIEADKKEAEKLAKAPIKNQLTVWVNSFQLPETSVDNATSKEIIAKFEALKKWSKEQIESL